MKHIAQVFLLLTLMPGIAAAEDPAQAPAPETEISNLSMQVASRLLTEAQELEQNSVNVLRNASHIRKQVNEMRVVERSLKDKKQKDSFGQSIDMLNSQLELWQKQGADLRESSSKLKNYALALIEEGFILQWSDWVKLTGPMRLQTSHNQMLAHNTQIRSVHPSMLNRMTATPETVKPDSMSLEIPAMTGQQAPADLDIRTFQASRDLNFFAHIEPLTEGSPEPLTPLNEIHKWNFLLSDMNGEPITDAKIEFSGHMPGHVHGLPTQPRITAESAPGVYKVDGVKFQMAGWWVIQFDVTAQGKSDTIVFNLVL
ncbi:FixH family protein [Hahella sp. NBU794]|uniref:FixH family protein n=1 Tax=Hahella sp. NBU794 TaxID=3422590 RepID=UPI003D6E7F3A